MNKMVESLALLTKLRRRVARLEGARARDGRGHVKTGCDAVDRWLCGGLAQGRLHEVTSIGADEASAAAGFAAALALRAGAGEPLLWLRTEAAERRAGRLHARGLVDLGLDGAAMLTALVADDAALLKAANDAARCAGVGAVLVECWGDPACCDLTATRRLMLAAEASGVTVLLLRLASVEAPSAADTRWRVAPAPSLPFDDGSKHGAPGHPAFEIELLRRRAGPAGRTWHVEWNRERRVFQELAAAPLSGALLPVAAG